MDIASTSLFNLAETNGGYGNAISKQISWLIAKKIQALKKNILQSK